MSIQMQVFAALAAVLCALGAAQQVSAFDLFLKIYNSELPLKADAVEALLEAVEDKENEFLVISGPRKDSRPSNSVAEILNATKLSLENCLTGEDTLSTIAFDYYHNNYNLNRFLSSCSERLSRFCSEHKKEIDDNAIKSLTEVEKEVVIEFVNSIPDIQGGINEGKVAKGAKNYITKTLARQNGTDSRKVEAELSSITSRVEKKLKPGGVTVGPTAGDNLESLPPGGWETVQQACYHFSLYRWYLQSKLDRDASDREKEAASAARKIANSRTADKVKDKWTKAGGKWVRTS